MLSQLEIHATLPVKDMKRAKQFYAEKLDMHPRAEMPEGLIYQCKNSWFMLYPSTGTSTGQFTQVGWQTDNIDALVMELKSRGIVFEEYDLPHFKTVNSIATTGPNRAAWFKDSEGNLLGIIQMG
jgi:catechol 2,3-dioxygenase-like lactoylglutathione lyase family enzyme